ncbi:MAG: hypothetical protein ACTSWX_13990 [Promethearchaeota archaeon]
MSLLKAENIKLRSKIEDLENRLLKLVGTIKIFPSGGGLLGNEHIMNNNIAEIITNASDLKIVAPYITNEYALILKDRAKNRVKVQIVLNDRRLWPQKHVEIYDQLKVTPGIDLINNPNVKFLLVWSPNTALFTSGPLDKESLMKTVLIGTLINEEGKLKELLKIFQLMLPSFMR